MHLSRLRRLVRLLFIAPMLAACGGIGPRESVSLRFAFPDTPDARAAAVALQQGYANVAPGVTLGLMPLPAENYGRSLIEQIKGGNGPDLFTSIDSDVPLLEQDGVLLDLRPHGVAPGSQSPNLLAPWQKADKLFGMPQHAVPQMLFYNRALFDAVDHPYPTGGWNWDEWRAAAKRLSNSERGVYGTSVGSWDSIIWNNAGDVLNADRTAALLDQPAAYEAIQFAADMVTIDTSAPLPKIAGGPDPATLFREGKLAMLPAPSSLISSLDKQPPAFAWDVAPMPTNSERTTPLAVTALAASAKTAHPDTAAGFISWAAGKEGLATTTMAFPYAVPALAEAAPAPLLRGPDAPAGGSLVVDALQYGRVPSYVTQTPAINKLVNESLVPVWQGQSSAEAAYRDVTPKINAILQGA